jgi:hypothetical protein
MDQNRDMWESSYRPRAHPAFRWMERRAMRSSSVPDSEGFGDHPDQYTGDPVWRLRVPGADAAPGQGLGTRPIGPAHSKHWPRSGRPGVRCEYDHQPDAPAASYVAPCAFTAVRDITGRMLLVRRCDTGDWELPGGHVDPGESASDAAVRGDRRGVRRHRGGHRPASTPTPATSSPTRATGWCASRSRCASMPAR